MVDTLHEWLDAGERATAYSLVGDNRRRSARPVWARSWLDGSTFGLPVLYAVSAFPRYLTGTAR